MFQFKELTLSVKPQKIYALELSKEINNHNIDSNLNLNNIDIFRFRLKNMNQNVCPERTEFLANSPCNPRLEEFILKGTLNVIL